MKKHIALPIYDMHNPETEPRIIHVRPDAIESVEDWGNQRSIRTESGNAISTLLTTTEIDQLINPETTP